MKEELLEILCCPECGRNNLGLKYSKKDNDEVEEGMLYCNCGNTYPIINGIPRFVGYCNKSSYDRDTKKKFEFQWEKWGRDELIFGKSKTDCFKFFSKFSGSAINERFLNGKLALDAGCGHGRLVEVFAELGANSVGVDLGDGVEIARLRTKNMKNANIIQADIMHLPFQKNVFDYIWSNGVIHHTPDTRKAFSMLTTVLKPKGYLDIWVYPKGNAYWEISQGLIRKITTKLPPALLSIFCYAAIPLLSIVKTYSGTQFPKNSWRQCAQVIYDWYSPKYQSHHTIEEIMAWYKQDGFENIENLAVPVAISGRKQNW